MPLEAGEGHAARDNGGGPGLGGDREVIVFRPDRDGLRHLMHPVGQQHLAKSGGVVCTLVRGGDTQELP